MTLCERYAALPDWCSPEQAAAFLGVSAHQVYRMLKSSCFECSWRVGAHGRWKISKESLAAAIGLPAVAEGDGHGA